jgi:hypothetical protein
MGGAALQVAGWSRPDCLVEQGSMDQRYPVSPSGGAGGYYRGMGSSRWPTAWADQIAATVGAAPSLDNGLKGVKGIQTEVQGLWTPKRSPRRQNSQGRARERKAKTQPAKAETSHLVVPLGLAALGQ